MVVIVLTACPVGLRGDLTRWLLEIAPGVFVGHIDARIRDRLWERIIDLLRDGRAVMVYLLTELTALSQCEMERFHTKGLRG